MAEAVSFLNRPRATNPATNPVIDEVVRINIAARRANALELLHAITEAHGEVTFANSFGAEDMVLTDLILSEKLPIEIFSLDTGRLPADTYTLMGEVEKHYGAKLKVFFPEASAVEQYVRTEGINAFYDSVELRKRCCAIRKVEPLRRALAGKAAWITGMRAAQSATRTDLPVRQFDEANGLEKYNPLSDWSEQDVWAYIRIHGVPYNALHDQFYPSIGCAPCTRAIAVGEDVRAGRWWWEDPTLKECGLHKK
ncbi:phosphoadenylyl-sulfate reductase [Uliginosibacterium paludis]|uniref:Adenosine 5'-phosphosulfate reductase n=1 Tax=Uliginosibacterium paludis TaxID=1615952 RepID=A0ABV2CSH6_9RHOO